MAIIFAWCDLGAHDECTKIIENTLIACSCKCHILEAEDILSMLE